MGQLIQQICDKTTAFIKTFFEIYLEKRDFDKVISMLDDEIGWFGTGEHEVCRNYADAIKLLRAEEKEESGSFKILEQWYQAVPMDEKFCTVFGQLKFVEDSHNSGLINYDSRFSAICRIEGEKISLIHSHFSVANIAQDKDEFVHKNLIREYNISLEEALIERTNLLKEKNDQIGSLMNNIIGGVELCKLDDDFTITYTSDGFLTLTGYSREEIKTLLNSKHTNLVHEEDSDKMVNAVKSQLDKNGCFSVEYRIKRKDGSILWVIDAGSFINTHDGKMVQCIFTDITSKKNSEELLKLSEKRYEIAAKLADVIIFDYDIVKDVLINNEAEVMRFNIPKVVENPAESMILNGVVKESSGEAFKQMYRKIHEGEASAQSTVAVVDYNGNDCIYQISLIAVYDDRGIPTRAIGVSRDITDNFELTFKAEHDMLTGIFNKVTTEQKINTYLLSQHERNSLHAFLMIDIDYFKDVNDRFSHVFGDAILSQVATKIREAFREDDIVGRIGGDEFVVFMKNAQNQDIVLKKVKRLITRMRESYTQGGDEFKLSVSIGISFYGMHGTDYVTLYKHADAALYTSKKKGRDCFTVYENKMGEVEPTVANIDQNQLLETKNFDQNVSEYVFKILHDATNKEIAINSILELIGKHYKVSRAYIFENSQDGKSTSNTFEWCNKNIKPQKENLQNISLNSINNYFDNFNEEGFFTLVDTNELALPLKSLLKEQGIESMLQFLIVKEGKSVGFIGFDECRSSRVPSKKEITELRSISNVLGVFLVEMRSLQYTQTIERVVLSIVNGLESYAYVCVPDTYEILFINSRTLEIVKDAKVGDLCYKAFWGKEAPCEDCPMRALLLSDRPRYSMDLRNSKLGIFIKATASWISWVDGDQACLIDSVDITKYVEGNRCE